MNKDAAFFSSMVVAAISLLSTIEIYPYYGRKGASITVIAALVWIGIGFYFKKSKG
ncbi:hypothetical protein [Tepidibacillus sp. LV47]|uniref:hypothetical protein n=1 Tax=Tepidibacillus sp. LV47 TaxID=3398228 RepID=UPI003AAEBE56